MKPPLLPRDGGLTFTCLRKRRRQIPDNSAVIAGQYHIHGKANSFRIGNVTTVTDGAVSTVTNWRKEWRTPRIAYAILLPLHMIRGVFYRHKKDWRFKFRLLAARAQLVGENARQRLAVWAKGWPAAAEALGRFPQRYSPRLVIAQMQ